MNNYSHLHQFVNTFILFHQLNSPKIQAIIPIDLTAYATAQQILMESAPDQSIIAAELKNKSEQLMHILQINYTNSSQLNLINKKVLQSKFVIEPINTKIQKNTKMENLRNQNIDLSNFGHIPVQKFQFTIKQAKVIELNKQQYRKSQTPKPVDLTTITQNFSEVQNYCQHCFNQKNPHSEPPNIQNRCQCKNGQKLTSKIKAKKNVVKNVSLKCEVQPQKLQHKKVTQEDIKIPVDFQIKDIKQARKLEQSLNFKNIKKFMTLKNQFSQICGQTDDDQNKVNEEIKQLQIRLQQATLFTNKTMKIQEMISHSPNAKVVKLNLTPSRNNLHKMASRSPSRRYLLPNKISTHKNATNLN